MEYLKNRWLEKTLAIVFFSILCAVVLADANPFLNEPGRDGGLFMYAGRQILQGKLLYVDVWDSKGPIIFYINALGLLLGKNLRWGVWGLEFLFLMISSLLGYIALKRRWGILSALFGVTVGLLGLKQLIGAANFTEE